MRVTVILLLFIIPCKSICQDTSGLVGIHVDTIHLVDFKPERPLLLSFHNLTFLLDYDKVKAEFLQLSQGRFRAATARDLLTKITGDIQSRDTAFLDQTYFEQLSWVPLDGLICNWIEERQCLLFDSLRNPVRSIIRVRGLRKNQYHYVWGGTLYLVPGETKPFKECTAWVS